jgi:hypothetical protein
VEGGDPGLIYILSKNCTERANEDPSNRMGGNDARKLRFSLCSSKYQATP